MNRLHFHSSNMPSEPSLSGATAESVSNDNILKIPPRHQWVTGHAGVYGGEAKAKK